MQPDDIKQEAPDQPALFRAAEYVRMSTEHQQYSTENQADKIREYAAQRGIDIFRTYADEGKSGLNIGGRLALQQLIKDVESDQRGLFSGQGIQGANRRQPGASVGGHATQNQRAVGREACGHARYADAGVPTRVVARKLISLVSPRWIARKCLSGFSFR